MGAELRKIGAPLPLGFISIAEKIIYWPASRAQQRFRNLTWSLKIISSPVFCAFSPKGFRNKLSVMLRLSQAGVMGQRLGLE